MNEHELVECLSAALADVEAANARDIRRLIGGQPTDRPATVQRCRLAAHLHAALREATDLLEAARYTTRGEVSRG